VRPDLRHGDPAENQSNCDKTIGVQAFPKKQRTERQGVEALSKNM
jgi:hypothetical protein